ncbi:fimbrillin family protein [Bacteroides congonensis]
MNKIKYFLYLFSIISVSLLTSCNGNDDYSSEVNGDGLIPLSIHVDVNGFTDNTGTQTRAGDNAFTTTFQEGDQLGIVVVGQGETSQNLCFTYNAQTENWVPEKTVIYSPHKKYVAYFPYSARLDGLAVSSPDAAITAIKEKNPPLQDQSLEDGYRASDLLTGVCTTTVDKSLTVSLSHAYSLLVLRVEGQYVAVAPSGANYQYKDYQYKDYQDVCAYIGNDNVDFYKAYSFDNSYRLIVNTDVQSNNPTKVKWFYTNKDDKTFTFVADNLKLPLAGSYKLFQNTITASTIREVKVGDYYYADGKIYPGEASDPPSNDCIGVVFHVGEGNGDNEHSGLNRSVSGYVIALNNADYDTNIGVTWGKNDINVSSDRRKYDGWNNTNIVKNTGRIGDYPAFERAVNYYPAAPANTSGWFLPSLRQFDDINAEKNRLNSIPIFTSFQQNSSQYNGHYWTSTCSDNNEAVDIDIINIYAGQVHSRTYTFAVRPILAF